jgi:hypothetical protein
MRIAPNGADTGLGVNLKTQAGRPFLITTCKFFTTAKSPSLPATSVSSTRRSTSARGIGGSIPLHRQYASAANLSCSGVISFPTPIIQKGAKIAPPLISLTFFAVIFSQRACRDSFGDHFIAEFGR